MKDDVGVDARDDVGQLRRLYVGTQERKPARAQPIPAKRKLQVGHNACAEVVDSYHLVAVGQQTVDQRRSDKSGGASHQDSHYQQPDSTRESGRSLVMPASTAATNEMRCQDVRAQTGLEYCQGGRRLR